jgi:hypothetical protein
MRKFVIFSLPVFFLILITFFSPVLSTQYLLKDGEEQKVTIGGTEYTVKNEGASDSTHAVISVNGVTKSVLKGSTYKISGLDVYISDIYYYSKEAQVSSVTLDISESTCYDPDGGLNYTEKSYVRFYGVNYWDRCVDSKILIEGYCDQAGNLILTTHTCSNSCSDGTCTSITTTTTTTTIEECNLNNVNIDTPHCRGIGGTCCAGDRIDVIAYYSGNCPTTAYLQLDLADNYLGYDGSGCEVYDDSPLIANSECNGLADIDGLSFPVTCSDGACKGSTQLPSGTYAVPAPDCKGVTVNTGWTGLYRDGFPCEEDNPVSYDAWTNSISGSISFGTDLQCGAITTTTTVPSTTTTTSFTTSTSTTTTALTSSTTTTIRTTTTSTTTTRTTTTSTTTTIGITTTTTVPTTTTTTIWSGGMTIQANEKYDSCPNNAYTINCNQIIRREVTVGESYDIKDYFKFTLDRRMKVRIHLSSTIIPDPNDPDYGLFGDYDLYAKWDGSCPNINVYYCEDYKTTCCGNRVGSWECGPCSEDVDEYNNMDEFCPEEGERTLEPGTYYFLVYNYNGDAPYDVNLICSDITQVTTTTTTTEGATTTTVSVQTTTTSISGSTTTMTTLEGATTTTTTVESTTTTIKEGRGGGCPILEAFNGKEFVKIEKLDIHSPKDQDTIASSTFTMQPINGKYEIILDEAAYLFWDGSHIDNVKLTDESGKECRLLSAVHSKDGDVLSAIEKSDDVRVRNFPGDEIRLTYDGCSGNTFTFSIEGYNMKWMGEDITTMVPIAIVIALLVSAIIIGILKVTKSKSAEPAPQYEEESNEEPFY